MLLVNWLNRAFSSFPKAAPKHSRRQRRLAQHQVEVLEDRCLLATFTVSNLNDAGAGSLRQAITDANNAGGFDTIEFTQSIAGQTITLASPLSLEDSVTINGPGGSSSGIIISGNNATAIIDIPPGASGARVIGLNNVTLTNGSKTGDGSAIVNFQTTTLNNVVISGSSSSGEGGAIRNDAQLTLVNSVLSNNVSGGEGGGLVNNVSGVVTLSNTTITGSSAGSTNGGGITNRGTLTINDSDITANIAPFAGGIFTSTGSTLRINRSTISGNVAQAFAGGIRTLNASEVTINASTISGNTSPAFGAGMTIVGGSVSITNSTIAHNVVTAATGRAAGGIDSENSDLTLTFVTIANNIARSSDVATSGGIVFGSSTLNTLRMDSTVLAQNLSFSNAARNNIVTDMETLLAGNQQIITDTRVLGPLQDNGGPTFTMMPLDVPVDSLINRGIDTPRTTDQRGFTGTTNTFPDVGAVEFQPGLQNPYVVAVASTGSSVDSQVQVFDGLGNLVRTIVPYPGLKSDIIAVLGDVTGDGVKDVITAPNSLGTGPIINIYNGVTGAFITQFAAYNAAFSGGLFIATGDFDNNGRAEIVTGPNIAGGPVVRIFETSGVASAMIPTLQSEFGAYPGGFLGGVRLAVGDTNGDNIPDIITGPGASGSVQPVRVFNGSNNAFVAEFTPFPGFTGGVYVAAGDVNNDGNADVIVGAGAGGGPIVVAASVSGASITPFLTVAPFPGSFTGGVRVAAYDANLDGRAEIIAAAGPGAVSIMRVINGETSLVNFDSIIPTISIDFTGGIFVSGSFGNSAGGSPLLLDAGESTPLIGSRPQATDESVAALTEAAIGQFAAAGLNQEGVAILQNATITVTDLEGDLLGLAFGDTIFIDHDAAGFGYFIDATPGDDIEFQTANSGTAGRVDLLTVIAHELGHILGVEPIDHNEGGVFDAHLAVGTRHRVEEDDLVTLDSLFGSGELF